VTLAHPSTWPLVAVEKISTRQGYLWALLSCGHKRIIGDKRTFARCRKCALNNSNKSGVRQ